MLELLAQIVVALQVQETFRRSAPPYPSNGGFFSAVHSNIPQRAN